MATVEVNYDNVAKGTKLEVPYLGVFENGSTTEVDDRKWERFLRNHPNQATSDSLREDGRLTLTTESAQASGAARREAQQAVRAAQGVDTPAGGSGAESGSEDEVVSLNDRKKDELVEMANALGVEDAESKRKSELVEAIEAQS